MKSNMMLKVVCGIVGAVAVMVFGSKIMTSSEPLVPADTGVAQPDNGLSSLSLDDAYLQDAYGIDADTPTETMKTLTEQNKALRVESETIRDDNKALRKEVERLMHMESKLNVKIDNNMIKTEQVLAERNDELEHKKTQLDMLMQDVQSSLQKYPEQLQNTSVEQDTPYTVGEQSPYDSAPNDESVVWIEPLNSAGIQMVSDAPTAIPSGIGPPDFTHQDIGVESVQDHPPEHTQSSQENATTTPVYTLPQNSTLLGSVAMTALLGRIPIGGQVTDPYPFKIIVGQDNLSSNGIHIPGIEGIKMSGFATGDWTLSCVSGQIHSMTFTFEDGTIVTVPKQQEISKQGIAWFSDQNGVPCITGKRITNAPAYLSQRIGLTAAASYANAKAQSQVTTQTNGAGGLTSGVTGNPRIVAKNSALSSGLNEVTDWLDARQHNSFDAIYVEPGTPVAIHMTQQIPIDFDTNGRKVVHHAYSDTSAIRPLD